MLCFSGVYPLFKPGASSLGGACLAAHVTIQRCSSFTKVIRVLVNLVDSWSVCDGDI